MLILGISFLVVGGLFLLAGLIYHFLLLIHAFKDSVLQGLLCLFVPFYLLYFLIARFQHPKKKRYVMLSILGPIIGIIFMAFGGGILMMHLEWKAGDKKNVLRMSKIKAQVASSAIKVKKKKEGKWTFPYSNALFKKKEMVLDRMGKPYVKLIQKGNSLWFYRRGLVNFKGDSVNPEFVVIEGEVRSVFWHLPSNLDKDIRSAYKKGGGKIEGWSNEKMQAFLGKEKPIALKKKKLPKKKVMRESKKLVNKKKQVLSKKKNILRKKRKRLRRKRGFWMAKKPVLYLKSLSDTYLIAVPLSGASPTDYLVMEWSADPEKRGGYLKDWYIQYVDGKRSHQGKMPEKFPGLEPSGSIAQLSNALEIYRIGHHDCYPPKMKRIRKEGYGGFFPFPMDHYWRDRMGDKYVLFYQKSYGAEMRASFMKGIMRLSWPR